MYIQLRNRQPDPSIKSPVITGVHEVSRFLTHPNGEVEFSDWSNDEIRLKPGPGESDLKNHRIDLNQGFSNYYEGHVKRVRKMNGCHTLHHNDARHLEKDDTMRKSFEATLKWIKETDYINRCDPVNKPKIITTSSAIHLLLQLPYENEVRGTTFLTCQSQRCHELQ
jgi:hypothetical protein